MVAEFRLLECHSCGSDTSDNDNICRIGGNLFVTGEVNWPLQRDSGKTMSPQSTGDRYVKHSVAGLVGMLAGAIMIVAAGLLTLYALNDKACTYFPAGTFIGGYGQPGCVPAGPGAGVFVFFLAFFGVAIIAGFARWGFLGKSWLPEGL